MKLDRLTDGLNSIKKPTINDIEFPNMRNSRQKRWKQQKSDNNVGDQHCL